MKLSSPIKFLLLSFVLIFAVKAGFSLFMNGPSIFADEPCAVQRAIHFAEYGKIETCTNILQLEAGDPQPLYSILISPIYLFAKGNIAYHLILIINALLVSSLIFPLFALLKRFIANEKTALIFAVILPFLPQIVAFESMLMTETLFLVINVWFLYFYANSLDEGRHQNTNKVIAIIFAVAAVISRPFGFILPAAMAINELFVSEKRRQLALFYIPLAFLSLGLVLWKLLPGSLPFIKLSLQNLDFNTVIKALKDQINSFTVITLAMPLCLFCTNIYRCDNPILKKMRALFISFILMNLVIATWYLTSHYANGQVPGLATRYINISIFYIVFLAIVFLIERRGFKRDLPNLVVFAAVAISLIFIEYQSVKTSLNIDMAFLFGRAKDDFDSLKSNYIAILAACIYAALFVLVFIKKQKVALVLLSAVFLVQSGFLMYHNFKFASVKSEVTEFFKDKENRILFMEAWAPNQNLVSYDYWRLLVLSKNKANVKFTGEKPSADSELKFTESEITFIKSAYDYVASTVKINLPLLQTVKGVNMGLNSNVAYIYKLN